MKLSTTWARLAAATWAGLVCVSAGLGPWSDGVLAQERPVCLSDVAADAALSAALVSEAPSPLCEPVFRTVELRNRSGAPLGAARLELVAPEGEGEMPFAPIDARADPPVYFQMSSDDGATWVAIGAPLRIGGRLVWTVEQAPPLARLGPNSAPDDSILLRWRAPLGEIYGGALAPDASIGVSGSAVDACGSVAEAPLRETLVSALQPDLSGRLVGRNASRGGPFSESVPAAPGDVIEWRLELDNGGEAAAREVTAEILTAEGPLIGAERIDEGESPAFAETGVLSLEPVPPGGLRTAIFRAPAPASCERQPIVAEITYGCAAPPPGRLSSIRAEGATPRAWIVAAPDGAFLSIAPSVSGTAGAAAPGSEAEIRVVLSNDGPPALHPALEIAPPDGFEIALDAEIGFRASTGRGPERLIGAVLEPGEGDRRVLRFIAAEGEEPVFSSGERVEIRVKAVRTRRTLSETDEVAAALLYRDGCGAEGRTSTARARTALRQAELEVVAEPVGGPILRLEEGAKTFLALISNVGEAEARTITLAVEPGPLWRDEPPEGCGVDPDAALGAPRFLCVFEEPLAPGGTLARRFELRLADAPREGAPVAGGLGVAVVADARAADASGAPTGAPLARAGAETAAVGFEITQRLTTVGGEPLDPENPIDLGQRVVIELDARWLGVGERVSDAAIALYLPPQLGFVEAEQTGGELELVGVRLPARGGSGRVLWSLGPIAEGASVSFRVEAVAIDVFAGETRDVFAASISQGASEADAIFSVDGEGFGVDAAEEGPTRAAPLNLIFRRPDLRIRLNIVGAEEIEAPFGAPQAPAGEGRWVAAPGEPVVVEAALGNLGAGPGYFDWVRIEAPPGVEILPFDTDGVDNDDDGRVDEADEATTAYLGPAEETLSGAVPTEARWSGAGGGALGGAERLIRPNGERLWRAALRIAPDTPPDRAYRLRVEAQFGAQPLPRTGGEARTRVIVEPSIGTAPATGFFVLTETSFGADLDDVVLTGEEVEHRLTLRAPPGALSDAVVIIDFAPAYRSPHRLDARFGAGLSCSGPAEGRIAEQEAGGGYRAIWRLGDCRAEADAPAEARLIIFDVGAAVADADPELSADDRADWRLPRVAGSISYVDPEAEGGRAEVRLGETVVRLSGPAPRLVVDPPRRLGSEVSEMDVADAAPLDAGDRFEGRLRLVNAGDLATSGAILRYGWPGEEGAAEAAIRGVDCAALALEAAAEAATIERLGPCLIQARFDFGDDPLEPGAVVELRLVGGLTAAAPIGGIVETPVAAVTAPAGAAALEAWTASDALPRASIYWAAPVRPPSAPTLEIARGDGPVAIGDTVLARGAFAIPEGAGPAVLLLRFRYEGRVGQAATSLEPILAVTSLTLTRSREDMTASADPSRVNVAATDAAMALREEAYETYLDDAGWTVVAAPLGEVAFGAPTEALGEGVYTLELAARILDVASASRGRALVAEAAILQGDDAELAEAENIWRSEPAVAAAVAEPYLDLAALHADADGSAQLGERVVFIGRACNRGQAPAYGAVITVELPLGFALDPNEPPGFLFDDGPEALGPRPYGVVEVGEDGRLTGAPRDLTPIEPGACVALRVPSFAERPAVAARGADGVFTAPAAAARFEIRSYRGRPSETDPGRRYSGLGPSTASVLRRDLVIDAPATAYIDPDGWIRHPFTIRRAGRLRDDARLSLVLSDADELTWTIFLDVNRDGQVDGGDRVWRDGAVLPQEGGLAFVARARPETTPPLGWRRTALLRAAAVTPDGRLLTGAREIVAARGSQRDGVMRAERLMAVDRDCDGRLEDEAAQDAAFEKAKEVAIGECVIMRVLFRNDGAASVERVQIEDVVPEGARFLEGSASFASTPAGLVGRGIDLPEVDAAGGRTRVRFRFVGALAPGLEGVVEYRVRIVG